MSTFRYKAVDKIGRLARGSLDAVNEIDLELRLKRMGLDLVTFRQYSKSNSILSRSNITRRDLINFCFDMEQITRVGIPILDGLRDLREGIENPRFREIITALLEDMEGGKTLSQCLASHPGVFNHVFVSLIRAGEQAGRLTEVFESLGSTLKWQDELVSQTKRLVAYPIFVFFVVMSVLIFLLVYLIPQVVTLLKSMNVELPLQTRILIGMSNGITGYWPVVFGVPIFAAIILSMIIRKNARARYLWDDFVLRVPVTGIILKKIILARFANFFALMYQSGITVLDALKTSEEIVANRVIADSLQRAGQEINAGDSLTESFRNLGVFPPLVIRMLRVGEATGALDSALLNVSYFYSRDVKESIDKALALLGPALTLVLGLTLALIMFSILSPIYDILGKLKF